MKTRLILIILLATLKFPVLSQSLSGGTWEVCPASTVSYTYTGNNMPSKCKYDWEVTNGTIYDGTTAIGTKLSSTTKLSIDVKWTGEPDYDYVTTTNGQFPKALIKVTSVGCDPSSNNGIIARGEVTIKSIKGFKIPSILVNSYPKNTGDQQNFTTYTGSVSVNCGMPPINYPPNSFGYVRTIYPTEFSWALPEGWTASGYSGSSFIGTSSLTLNPTCWGYSAGSTRELKVTIRHPDYGCIVGSDLQKGADFVFKVQKDAPYITSLSSTVSNLTWGVPKSFSLTANTNITPAGLQYVWNLPVGYTRTSTGSSGQIITTVPILDVTTTACNTTEPISVFVQKENCNKSGIVTKTFVFSYPIMNGSSYVCTAGSNFSISGLPSGASITWNKSSNITMISAQNTNPCMFSANGIGGGWIQASISLPNGCSYSTPQYSVWVGAPFINNIYGPRETCPLIENFYSGSVPGATSYIWDVPGIAYAKNDDYYSRDIVVIWDMYASVDILTLRAGNNCGWTQQTINITMPEQCLNYYYSLSPNPASNSVEITINELQNHNTQESESSKLKSTTINLKAEKTKYTVRIFNMNGALVYSSTQTGVKFSIPTNNLNDGSYIIDINDGVTSYKKQLLIKH